ncbi:class I SAM-dependent methyltransferase [Rhodovibrionaceae bacterium A322]
MAGTAAFDGLAENYDRYRPDYPDSTWDSIREALSKGRRPALALDIGAGTGIASRALADALGADWQVIGVEPNKDMRLKAESLKGPKNLSYRKGDALSFPAKPGEVGFLLVAQALHWFDRPAFYSKAAEALSPKGVLAILYNERDRNTPLMEALESRLEAEIPGYSRAYRSHDYSQEIAALAWVRSATLHRHSWSWSMGPEVLAGLIFSRANSQPWVERVGEEKARAELVALAQDFIDQDGLLDLPFTTDLLLAEKKR